MQDEILQEQILIETEGERESLADFQEMEPELSEQAIYSEFEDTLQIVDAESVTQWCRWVTDSESISAE